MLHLEKESLSINSPGYIDKRKEHSLRFVLLSIHGPFPPYQHSAILEVEPSGQKFHHSFLTKHTFASFRLVLFLLQSCSCFQDFHYLSYVNFV